MASSLGKVVVASEETTPLLATTETPVNEELLHNPETNNEQDEDEDEDKPLPRTQIFLLCYARVVEPIAFFAIFPFINKMIYETGSLEEAEVGFYSGLIESLFSLTQMAVMIAWGYLADRLGRKPVLVFSLAGVSIATGLFGLSKTIGQMIFLRCSAGVFAGTVVTIRAMISENSTKKTQARAFSLFSFSAYIGIFVGPFIGGALSNPAEQYPSIFGKFHFFKEYPYFLPTFIAGAMGMSAAITSGLFIKETLDRDAIRDPKKNPPMSTWELIRFPGVAKVFYIYGHVMLLAFAFTAVFPLFMFTEPSLGGFGFSPLEISAFMTLAGASQALWILLVFPPLQHRLGTGGVLQACSLAWPIMFAINPLANLFLRHHWDAIFWTIAPVNLALGSGVCMAFTAVQLALNDISPTHATLGTLNAIALTVTSGLRAFTPALFASIFAIGAKTQVLSGHLAWLVMVIIALALAVFIKLFTEKSEGRLKNETNDEGVVAR